MRFLAALFFLLAGVLRDVFALEPFDPTAPAAYFATTTANNGTYVVAMNFVQNGDIYIHMHATTARSSWVGVGLGDNMDGAFMLIAYKAADGTGMTTSPRVAVDGHSEPVWQQDLGFEKIFDDAYAPNANTANPNGIMISHGVCRNCSGLGKAKLDYGSKAQPFIFAVGPKRQLESDELDAPLRRHEFYGHFTVDMTVATTNASSMYGRVPAPNIEGTNAAVPDSQFETQGAEGPFDAHEDHDRAPAAHAVLMCLAFVLVFPLGALMLRFLKSVLWHAVAQAVGVLSVLVGFGIGIRLSREYNRVRP